MNRRALFLSPEGILILELSHVNSGEGLPTDLPNGTWCIDEGSWLSNDNTIKTTVMYRQLTLVPKAYQDTKSGNHTYWCYIPLIDVPPVIKLNSILLGNTL